MSTISRLTYYQQLKTSEWAEKSVELKKEAGWRCELCKRHHSESALQVHHTYYYREMMLWEYPRCLLIVLCDECHLERQALEERIYVNVADVIRDMTNEELKEQPIFTLFHQ